MTRCELKAKLVACETQEAMNTVILSAGGIDTSDAELMALSQFREVPEVPDMTARILAARAAGPPSSEDQQQKVKAMMTDGLTYDMEE